MAILGTTFTGEFEPIEEIHDALVKQNAETGWEVPMHVDAASGGFVAPFLHPDLKWDFRLPLVKSINASGHKYGLVYPGVGWVVWRSHEDLPEDLVFHVNYLGGDMPTFTLNFSRPGNQVVGQYYNFLRLGRAGYTQIMEALRDTAMGLSGGIAEIGPFELVSDGSAIPVFAFKLKDEVTGYSVFDVSDKLREFGWQVPAYTMPEHAEDVAVLRVVVREGFSATWRTCCSRISGRRSITSKGCPVTSRNRRQRSSRIDLPDIGSTTAQAGRGEVQWVKQMGWFVPTFDLKMVTGARSTGARSGAGNRGGACFGSTWTARPSRQSPGSRTKAAWIPWSRKAFLPRRHVHAHWRSRETFWSTCAESISIPTPIPDDMVSLRLWLEPERIVTSRHRPLMAISDLRERIGQGRGPQNTGDFLVEVAGRLVGRMSPVIEALDETGDELEDQLLTGESKEIRTTLAELRRQAIGLRRYLSPQREAMSRILAEPVAWLDARHKARLRETSDRVLRYVEDLDAIRERAAVIQDEVANRVSESINKNMYMLAIVATIMLPLGLITGLLGVNVDGLPFAHNAPWAFGAVTVLLVVLVWLEVFVMRRLKWF